jgi:hypothetical protein
VIKDKMLVRRLKLLAVVLVLLFVACPLVAFAADLTGTWKGSDDGIYYLRQSGSTIWWYGESSVTNPGWTNVAYGTVAGSSAVLFWADVPKGGNMGSGVLVLNIDSDTKLSAQSKLGDGFSTQTWTKQ